MKYIFTPMDYFYLCKMDYVQEFMLKPQEEMDKKIGGDAALGGIYESISEDDKFIYLKNGDKILKQFLIPYVPGKYDFKVGQNVVFSPVCSELEIKDLTWNNRLIINNEYKVCRVINYYYVKLIDEYGNETMPIRFCDIKPIV